MLQYIRNFYHQMFFNPEESFQHVVPESLVNKKDSPMLTLSELQQLRQILTLQIKAHEDIKQQYKQAAQSYAVGSVSRDYLFHEHRAVKQRIATLNALQYRLKHKIVTWG